MILYPFFLAFSRLAKDFLHRHRFPAISADSSNVILDSWGSFLFQVVL